eukprot:CAMPEP_0117450468 /NCGR_PEP_ID=MMETSP0759-20121206/8483_1 /TAXON_ID=63605 /ORGANISM="Percolomonas cosmopolitus, Strain WS" /LENGTH=562 /DNA_ID=CAMNT_0005242989 /DNA_START=300 /DNA_END=1988 /DNA_ORIENTATION=+
MGGRLSILNSTTKEDPFKNATGGKSKKSTSIGTWNTEDVRNWLRTTKLDDFTFAFQSKRINGVQLLNFHSYNQIDEQFRTFPAEKKKALWRHIEKLKHEHPCLIELPKSIKEKNTDPDMLRAQRMVLGKLNKLRGFDKLSEEDKVEKARNLFIADRMVRTYLSESFIGTYKVMDDLFVKGREKEREEEKRLQAQLATKEVKEEPTNSQQRTAEASSIEEQQNQLGADPQGTSTSTNTNTDDDLPADIIAEDTHETANNHCNDSSENHLDIANASIESDDDEVDLNQLSAELDHENNPHYNLAKKRLKIKLVIVDHIHHNTERFFRHALSPVMEKFRLAPTFGIFHSAIIVGPFYLEFNDSGLCIPRKCCSNAAVIAADMSAEFSGPSISVALDRISKIICYWNANLTYSSKKNNCQTFVEELCKGLGIDVGKQTENSTGLGQFFSELRAYGKCDLKFVVSDELMEKCGDWIREDKNVNGRSIKFKTHEQLDQFVDRVNQNTNYMYFQFSPQGKDDWVLLKSFDRAFWLRHFKDANHEQFKPCICPFGDPRISGSIVSSWFAV